MRTGSINRNDFAGPDKAAQAVRTGKTHIRKTETRAKPKLQEIEIQAEDTVVISEESKRKGKDQLQEMQGQYQMLLMELEKAREQGEAMGAAWKERIKCLKIAMRIMAGDKVPEEDHRYLQKTDPDLYGKAIMMKINKKDPKEYDRISEDEEDGGPEGAESLESTRSIQSSSGEIQEISTDAAEGAEMA